MLVAKCLGVELSLHERQDGLFGRHSAMPPLSGRCSAQMLKRQGRAVRHILTPSSIVQIVAIRSFTQYRESIVREHAIGESYRLSNGSQTFIYAKSCHDSRL